MSSILFHTLNEEPLSIGGPERPHAALTAVQTTLSALGADVPGGILALTQSGIIPREALDLAAVLGKSPLESLEMWLNDPLGMATVTIEGEASPVGHAVLNTAAVAGPDPVAFLARLHGSVENRIWVAAEDAVWLAGVLQEGRESGVLREDMGWEAVIERLSATSSPVVISTSAGRTFPGVEYDDEAEEVITPDDPEAAWLASFEEVKAQGWWQHLTPANLREPAYIPLTTFQDALEEKNPALATALRGEAARTSTPGGLG